MIKISTKQKTVEFESRDIVCDLCEAEVPVGQATITLSPFIAKEQGERHGGSAEHRIDICSVDCMVKNAGAAGLLLNTKILPELRGTLPVKRASGKLSNQDLIDMIADDDYLKKAAAAKSYKSAWSSTYKYPISLSFDKYATYKSAWSSTYKSFDKYATQVK